MTADLDTLSRPVYAPGAEVLPAGAVAVAAAGAVAGVGSQAFAASRELFGSQLEWLAGAEAAALEHGELEARLEADARELSSFGISGR